MPKAAAEESDRTRTNGPAGGAPSFCKDFFIFLPLPLPARESYK
jgi:hypothetical protein